MNILAPTPTLSITLAQINLTVGDIIGNTRRLCDLLRQADNRGIELIVFPELSVCGYPSQDLLLRADFLNACEQAVEEIRQFSQGKHTACIFGVPEREDNTLYNTALVVQNGLIRHKHRKQKLPNYAVFDEKRWFTPGDVTGLYRHTTRTGHEVHLGISICEDIWGNGDTVHAQADMGAEYLINLSASPYARHKPQQRLEMLRAHARRWRAPIVYTNLVGGQDSLVFDGSSPVLTADGEVAGCCPAFSEALLNTQWEKTGETWQLKDCDIISLHHPVILRHRHNQTKQKHNAAAEQHAAIALGIADYYRKNGFQKAWIGLSGGIDSAVTAVLAADALGAKNVTGVLMPSRYSSDHSVRDALALAKNLGIRTHTLPIEPAFSAFLSILKPVFGDAPPDTTEENLQARIRGVLLMALANKHKGLVLATGNKSELSVGYATLYGDMAGAYAPLKDLYKTEVYALARWLNAASTTPLIPLSTLEKAPSAELRPNQKDSDKLPDYACLDDILRQIIENKRSLRDIIAAGHDVKVVETVAQQVRHSEHKRFQAPPGPRLSEQAFDGDRRIPLSNAFDWRQW